MPASTQISTRREAPATSVSPQALKNSFPPPNVAVPRLSAETLRPEPPSRRYSMADWMPRCSSGCRELIAFHRLCESLHVTFCGAISLHLAHHFGPEGCPAFREKRGRWISFLIGTIHLGRGQPCRCLLHSN